MVTQGEITDRTLENLSIPIGAWCYIAGCCSSSSTASRAVKTHSASFATQRKTPRSSSCPWRNELDYTLAGVSATPDRSWDNPVPKEAAE